MTTVSIVIVNYNVKYFLARCISSILDSKINANLDIIIIDNGSSDGSEEYITTTYGHKIKYIYNPINQGFAKANNQGFQHAKGDFILVLNPDTIIAEDTLQKCIDYLLLHPNVGALGVRMIDGSGQFLPESKRAIPSLWTSFTKISGLSDLFPQSDLFTGYYLGNINELDTANVQVLSGAFMMLPKHVIHEVNGFDEDYFMYGEDIDLCVKIKKLGFDICYFPETTIIHFKGESSSRSSISYNKNFYNAMLIYISKHGDGLSAIGSTFLIKFSIIFVGILSFIKSNFLKSLRLIVDSIILYTIFHYMRMMWGKLIFNNVEYFNNYASNYNSISAVIIWIASIWFMGHYDKPWKHHRLILGILLGTIIILSIYSLLPANMRSSRAMIILGMIPLYLMSLLSHYFLIYLSSYKNKNFEYPYSILTKSNNVNKLLALIGHHYVNPNANKNNSRVLLIDSLSYSNKEIIDMIDGELCGHNVALSGGRNDYILKSFSKHVKGDSITQFSNMNLGNAYYKRLKRSFDMLLTLYILILSIFKKNLKSEKIKKNIGNLLLGKISLVGYILYNDSLPKIKNGIFDTKCLINDDTFYPVLVNEEMADKYYGQNYSIYLDYIILFKNLKQ
jgi:GT2 family glycosyltransferase